MACHSLMTETMTGETVTVLCHIKERGDTIIVIPQTSMGCTSAVRVTLMVWYGTISMSLQEVHIHFDIQI